MSRDIKLIILKKLASKIFYFVASSLVIVTICSGPTLSETKTVESSESIYIKKNKLLNEIYRYETKREYCKTCWDKLIKLAIKPAKMGSGIDAYILGLFYYRTKIEGKKNYLKAIDWFHRSSVSGNAASHRYLCHIYKNGIGIKRNLKKSFEHCTKSSQMGDPVAEYILGEMYFTGCGTEKNKALGETHMYSSTLSIAALQDYIKKNYGMKLGMVDGIWGPKSRYSVHSVKIKNTNNVHNGELNKQFLEKLDIENIRDKNQILSFYVKEKIKNDMRRLNSLPNCNKGSFKSKDINLGKFHALVIGNNEYNNFQNLNNAINDARVISKILKDKYGYKVRIKINATRKQILDSLYGLQNDLNENDNLLIYFAGHGEIDESTNYGYWLPIDADKEIKTQWISNERVGTILKGMKAKNVIIIADSCYAGTLFRGSKKYTYNANTYQVLSDKRSRVAIASGGIEQVIDSIPGSKHSVFAAAFIDTLKRNDSFLAGQKLGLNIIEKVLPVVSQLGVSQTPEYYKLFKAGHEGGDFVFGRK